MAQKTGVLADFLELEAFRLEIDPKILAWLVAGNFTAVGRFEGEASDHCALLGFLSQDELSGATPAPRLAFVFLIDLFFTLNKDICK